MKTIIRVFKNIAWLLNHPATSICQDLKKRKCDYCDNTDGWTHYQSVGMTLCNRCLKRIADKVLKN